MQLCVVELTAVWVGCVEHTGVGVGGGACSLAVAEGQCSHWVLWLCLLQVQSVDVAAFNKI